VIIRTFIFTVLTIITNPGPQLFTAADDHPGHLPEHFAEHPVLSAAGIFIKQTFVWFVKTIFVMKRKSRDEAKIEEWEWSGPGGTPLLHSLQHYCGI